MLRLWSFLAFDMNYFELEKRRRRLAKKNQLKKLKKTYSGRLPELTDLNTDKFWDKKHKDYEMFPMAQDRTDKVYNYLKDRKGNLLEVGFGKGYLLKKLGKSNNLKIFGTDISSSSIKTAKKSIKGSFKKGNISRLPFKSNFFDIVVVLEVLEHISIKKNTKALSEVRRVLKKGGELVVSVPLNEGLEKMVLKGENPNGHLRVYSPELLRAELKMSGFVVERAFKLYAFNSFYTLKSIITRIFPTVRKPNNLILFACKK